MKLLSTLAQSSALALHFNCFYNVLEQEDFFAVILLDSSKITLKCKQFGFSHTFSEQFIKENYKVP